MKELKRTKLGLIFLISAAGCYALAFLVSIVGCITFIFNLAALGLGITAVIFLLMGVKAYRSPHKFLIIGSISLVGVAIVFKIFITIMMISVMVSSILGSTTAETLTGKDIADMMESMKPFIIMLVIPYLMLGIALIIPVFMITPVWGKAIAGIFGGLLLVGLAIMVVVQIQNIDSLVDGMDETKEYEGEEYQEVQTEMTMKAWLSQLVLGGVHFLALGCILGALLENGKRIKDAQNRKQSMPYGYPPSSGPLY